MTIVKKIILLCLSSILAAVLGIDIYIYCLNWQPSFINLLILSLIILLIESIIVFYLARQIMIGIKNLTSTFDDIYQGKLEIEVLSRKDDETFEIAMLINHLRCNLIECRAQMAQNTSSLQVTNQRMLNEIVQRKRVENELVQHKNHLEELVKDATLELQGTLEMLKQEIAERKLSQERQARMLIDLEAVNQELNDFAYIISHDLKAPLRSIGSLVDWIINDYSDKLDQEGKNYMSLLVKRVRRMHSLIESLLGYSVLGRFVDKMVDTDISQTVMYVIEELNVPSHIQISIIDKLPILTFEKDLMRQIFYHLIGNAIKFIDKEKGEIKITCKEDQNTWIFNVEDNGIGIEEKYFDKIFQIFQTLTSRDEFESNGIGLTIVKKIVEMYGGSLWVTSTLNIGSKFSFTLPKNINQ
ncbi:MAG: GHKL domain-containing protein [Nitrospirae bacterium]|nr:GHKL domain-containing protein [Nitrospirota bacterium]